MRKLTPRERRTIRLGAAGLAVYLVLFYGGRGWKLLEAKREEYSRLSLEAEKLKLEVLREKVKALRLEKLRRDHPVDFKGLRASTLVSDATAAIQKSAQALGLALGTCRETPGRSSGKELSVLQIEGKGPTAGALQFVHGLGFLGFPLVVDWLQIKTKGMQPGQIGLSLGVAVLDMTAWKSAEVRAPAEAGAPTSPAPAETPVEKTRA